MNIEIRRKDRNRMLQENMGKGNAALLLIRWLSAYRRMMILHQFQSGEILKWNVPCEEEDSLRQFQRQKMKEIFISSPS